MSAPEMPTDQIAALAERLKKFNRIVSTPAAVGLTPKETVWTLNKAKLYRYTPVVPPERRYPVPLLLIFALITRSWILDLRPGYSFVEYMVGQGFDVYLLDWGSPGIEDKNLKFDDYALEYLPRAIRKVKAISGSEEFSMLGWCIGAILTTIYAAMIPDDGLRNMVLLTAPLDFSNRDAITFARWTDERYFNVDKVLDTFGNMPSEIIDAGARSLKPIDNNISYFCKLWDNLDNPHVVEAWQAMNTWVTDRIPMAGAAYRQMIVDLYRHDDLINNRMRIRNQMVELTRIRANLLSMIADDDHITPPCQSESIFGKVSSQDKEVHHLTGGHIGIMVGKARQATWSHISDWLAARSR
jgi:polyhydroxyalkanoate synthase subunit PhaC